MLIKIITGMTLSSCLLAVLNLGVNDIEYAEHYSAVAISCDADATENHFSINGIDFLAMHSSSADTEQKPLKWQSNLHDTQC